MPGARENGTPRHQAREIGFAHGELAVAPGIVGHESAACDSRSRTVIFGLSLVG
jgi:hypothetical protein